MNSKQISEESTVSQYRPYNGSSQWHALPCAILIIVGIGGLAAAGLGIGGELGSISNLSQFHSLIMIGVGGGGGIISLILSGIYIHIARRNIKRYKNQSQFGTPSAYQPLFPDKKQVHRYQLPFSERASEGILRGEKVFDESMWETTFGVKIAGKIPPKPDVDWERPCPFSGDETVQLRHTHMLVLIPAAFDAIGIEMKLTLQNVIEYTRNGPKCDYQFEDFASIIHEPVEKSYWVLMARDILPDSTSKDIPAQQRLLNRKGQAKYDFPRIIEAVVCISAEFALSGTRLFPDYATLCKEHAQNDGLITDERDQFGNPIGVTYHDKEGISIRLFPNGPDKLAGAGAVQRFV